MEGALLVRKPLLTFLMLNGLFNIRNIDDCVTHEAPTNTDKRAREKCETEEAVAPPRSLRSGPSDTARVKSSREASQALRVLLLGTRDLNRGNHLSSTTCLTQVFFRTDESCSKLN